MKLIFSAICFGLLLVAVLGNVMPNDAVPLGTWKRSEQIEWEAADIGEELQENQEKIKSKIENMLDSLGSYDQLDNSDGSQSTNTHSRSKLRYESSEQITIYESNSESEVEKQTNDDLLILVILGIFCSICVMVGCCFKKRMDENNYPMIQRELNQQSVTQIENVIRFHQNHINQLRKYFIQAQPVQNFVGYHYPQQYDSSRSHHSHREDGMHEIQLNNSDMRLQRYSLARKIGEGNNSVIRLATDLLKRQRVAVKIIHKPPYTQKLKRYLNILKSLPRHPNIIEVFEIIETSDKIYIVMELIQSSVANKIVRQKLSETETIQLYKQVMSGIQCLHQQRIAHNSISLQTIYISQDGKYKIIPKHHQQSEPSYFCPQKISKMNFNLINSDIWSSGIFLYFLLVGQNPFKGSNTQELYHQILKKQLTFPPRFNKIAKLLLKGLLNKHPQQRLTMDQIKHWISLLQYQSKKQSISQNRIDSQQNIQEIKQLKHADQQMGLKIFQGEYESHYVFKRNPQELFSSLTEVLDKMNILWNKLGKYILETQNGLRISLQIFEGLDSAFIIVFGQKTQLNTQIMHQLSI